MEDNQPVARELLALNHLKTGYAVGRKQIVITAAINATIYSGEFIAVLGPNGAGKSTLLKTILGHLKPLHGKIEWQNKPTDQMSARQMASCMAAVLTDKIDDRYLTAYHVVSTGRYPYGSLTGKLTPYDRQTIEEAMTATGVETLASRKFYSLSDGEKQKTMIARAIAQQTPLICLDEPTAFIDSPGKVSLMRLLKKLSVEHQKSILLTTHDSELAMQFADKLWLLGHQDFQSGLPQTMIKEGHINRLFDQADVAFNPLTLRFESK
ncbi:MAG: ABC transporter ATP-binding protein [Bacteroidetes bacterium]|nr:ABC transporter ATP-binding protein [Bacteroidota bacterium]